MRLPLSVVNSTPVKGCAVFIGGLAVKETTGRSSEIPDTFSKIQRGRGKKQRSPHPFLRDLCQSVQKPHVTFELSELIS